MWLRPKNRSAKNRARDMSSQCERCIFFPHHSKMQAKKRSVSTLKTRPTTNSHIVASSKLVGLIKSTPTAFGPERCAPRCRTSVTNLRRTCGGAHPLAPRRLKIWLGENPQSSHHQFEIVKLKVLLVLPFVVTVIL